MNKIKIYFKKLLRGEISLFIVFWFWFIFISFCIEVFFQIESLSNTFYETNYFQLFLYLIILIYSILIFMFVFKSANNYKGSKIWSFLSKVIVSINLFFSLSYFTDILEFYFLEDYSIENETQSFR